MNQEFALKNDLQAAAKHYCMKQHHEAQVVESTTAKYSMKCRNQEQGCDWRVQAIKPKNSNAWVVTKWVGSHSCVNQNLSQDHKQLDSEIIFDVIIGMMHNTI